jgi:quinolinate synthase
VATNAAISWANSGFGYYMMEKALNEYIEAFGANVAIGDNLEMIKNKREAAAQRINLCAIHAMTEDRTILSYVMR